MSVPRNIRSFAYELNYLHQQSSLDLYSLRKERAELEMDLATLTRGLHTLIDTGYRQFRKKVIREAFKQLNEKDEEIKAAERAIDRFLVIRTVVAQVGITTQ